VTFIGPTGSHIGHARCPSQSRCDFLTFREHIPKAREDVAFSYLCDARFNMAGTYLIGGAKLGMDVRIASPRALWPRQEITDLANWMAEQGGGTITLTEDVGEAVAGCDVLFTDVWVSMGEASRPMSGRSESISFCPTRSTRKR
jgi:ornithine carbamoyltransferase